MNIRTATSKEEILRCTEVMQALRPHLNADNIAPILEGMMTRGYHLVYVEEDGRAVSAAGYRFTEHLHWGKAIYVDDLSTLPAARKKGHARALLDFIVEQARKNQCREVHLDSGCIPSRYDAHRLYLNYGFNITSHHFALKVTSAISPSDNQPIS
jgi:GNAT superfamily N-acetyltransferase